jgi:uncharacterized protein (TIGR00369 family)
VSEPALEGSKAIREFLASSPFAQRVGMDVRRVEAGEAELGLKFSPENATAGDTVHGGAISTLIDTAATAAAWAADFAEVPTRWGTASLTVNFLRPAQGSDLVASAKVTRRGRTLTYCHVDVSDGDGVVAEGLVAYALSADVAGEDEEG